MIEQRVITPNSKFIHEYINQPLSHTWPIKHTREDKIYKSHAWERELQLSTVTGLQIELNLVSEHFGEHWCGHHLLTSSRKIQDPVPELKLSAKWGRKKINKKKINNLLAPHKRMLTISKNSNQDSQSNMVIVNRTFWKDTGKN